MEREVRNRLVRNAAEGIFPSPCVANLSMLHPPHAEVGKTHREVTNTCMAASEAVCWAEGKDLGGINQVFRCYFGK